MRSLDGGRSDYSHASSAFVDDAERSPIYPPQPASSQARPLLQHAQTEPAGPIPSPGSGSGASSPHVRIADPGGPGASPYRQYDAARAQGYPMGHRGSGIFRSGGGGKGSSGSPGESTDMSRNQSWDLLAGVRKFEQGYERFDSRNASETHLQFADGDLPKNGVSVNSFSGSHFGAGTLGGHSMASADAKEARERRVKYGGMSSYFSSVREILQLSAQRVDRHEMDAVHRSCPGLALDSRHPGFDKVPRQEGKHSVSAEFYAVVHPRYDSDLWCEATFLEHMVFCCVGR